MKPASTPGPAVEQILAADRICWFPIRHFSPASAWQVRTVIEALQPDAVLVEGPDDATGLIPALVHGDTAPPVSILSTWVDRKNLHELNGTLSPSVDTPVRYRGWWPFVRYSPEYQALLAGQAVGAELAFIDAPLPATLPFHQARRGERSGAVDDRSLAESRYFRALAERSRRRDFEDFWQATFEVGGIPGDTLDHLRRVLTFAWCTRNMADAAAFEHDGTTLREAHMAWHIQQVRKRHPGWIVVVTGAFHSVALPFTKPRRSKAKADRDTTTLLCAHSHAALARLYTQNQAPGYGKRVWDAAERGEPHPHEAAAHELVVDVLRRARTAGMVVSTADGVGALRVAKELARLRGTTSPTHHDVLDALEMAYVKGDQAVEGVQLAASTQLALVGREVGKVAAHGGQTPLLSSFYSSARAHRLDVSGAHKVVRCDLGKSEGHRRKSAFLHRCEVLAIPWFASADRLGGEYFRGPDPVAGTGMNLITETWGLRWNEEVDDRLIELSDRGSTLADCAVSWARDELPLARRDASSATELLVRVAQMMLHELADEVLDAVDEALVHDRRLLGLAHALGDFVVLLELRSGAMLHGSDRLWQTVTRTVTATILQLPQLGVLEGEDVRAGLSALQDLLRLLLAFDDRPLDPEPLIGQLERLLAGEVADARIHGGVLGALHALGRCSEARITADLRLRVAGKDALELGGFLEGLFTMGRSVMTGTDRLIAAVDEVLAELDWDTFRRLLPDLRRAFTHFIPSEIDELGRRIAARIGLTAPPDPDRPVPDGLFALVSAADARASAQLTGWWREPG